VKSSVKRIEDAKRSVEEASTLGEKGIWLVENAVEDASKACRYPTAVLPRVRALFSVYKTLYVVHLLFMFSEST